MFILFFAKGAGHDVSLALNNLMDSSCVSSSAENLSSFSPSSSSSSSTSSSLSFSSQGEFSRNQRPSSNISTCNISRRFPGELPAPLFQIDKKKQLSSSVLLGTASTHPWKHERKLLATTLCQALILCNLLCFVFQLIFRRLYCSVTALVKGKGS